ncbi:MAG: hypothetical protein HDR77_05070 [Bacteroides sp.]|nr:hypothetical protein [Bacteroides sp.]
MNRRNDRPGHPTLAILIAVALVAAASFLPLHDLSEGRVKDYSLLADILKIDETVDSDDTVQLQVEIDPELARMMAESTQPDSTVTVEVDTVSSDFATDTTDSVETPPPPAPLPAPIIAERDSRGVVPIEDYTPEGRGLSNLRAALSFFGTGRIAVVGDSYIEGDIFTQDLRSLLQQTYGGSGVGYMSMFSEFPGFRRSVRQSGSGWTTYIIGKKGSDNTYQALSEHYFKPDGQATSTFKGTDKVLCASQWDISRFLFIAPEGGSVNLKTGSETLTYELTPSDSVQCISYSGLTGNLTLSSSTSSLVALGVWLDSSRGISVDCMSSRGFSGLTLRNINTSLCREMSRFIPYNLIILEFGINAMSPRQKDFSVYSDAMVKVIDHVRQCYPEADILLMGIGDRGEKRGGDVHSMASVQYMIEAQRTAARKARCLFWDTREAMGGNDAIVEWTRSGYANKDYIHMTHKGGARLAKEFFNSLQQMLP